MRPWGPIVALVIGGAAGNACLIDLDSVIACGDGYVDELAGEQCDTAVPASYRDACVGTVRPYGIGACDPDTCQLINDVQQCARCGDGILDEDAGEECDGNSGGQCPDGTRMGCNQCRNDASTCDTCGNGVLDPGEECDPRVASDGGGIVVPRQCAGSATQEPLDSPYTYLPFTSGSTISCLPNCDYDRTNCGYCGNGRRDGASLVSRHPFEAVSLAEECDGDDIDLDFLDAEYPDCAQVGARANVACDTNCLGYVELPGPRCCLDKGEACPADGATLRCCFEYSHPEVEDACLPVFDPGEGGGSGGGGAFQCR